MRILGLDHGERRIGVAVSDATGTIATPHSVIDRRAGDVRVALRTLVTELAVERVVVGLPLLLSGGEGQAARSARAFADQVAEETGLPVSLQDERYTTVTAEDALIEGGVSRRRRREVRDKVAAAVMLQSYLDRRTHDDDGEHEA
ncbi:MAG: Holliday junction resolvase RuvX [Acidimicrobiia bacterium]|nr:MAG: Holliday junction resolvase RuvX [Acidimicrobiia bacterium]